VVVIARLHLVGAASRLDGSLIAGATAEVSRQHVRQLRVAYSGFLLDALAASSHKARRGDDPTAALMRVTACAADADWSVVPSPSTVRIGLPCACTANISRSARLALRGSPCRCRRRLLAADRVPSVRSRRGSRGQLFFFFLARLDLDRVVSAIDGGVCRLCHSGGFDELTAADVLNFARMRSSSSGCCAPGRECIAPSERLHASITTRRARIVGEVAHRIERLLQQPRESEPSRGSKPRAHRPHHLVHGRRVDVVVRPPPRSVGIGAGMAARRSAGLLRMAGVHPAIETLARAHGSRRSRGPYPLHLRHAGGLSWFRPRRCDRLQR